MSHKSCSAYALTEVRKGQTGSGLLIEKDGHIIGDSDTIKQIREDIEVGHKLWCPDHFVVSAVFQKFNIKNANGRVYPEAVLKREVDKYIKERVEKRCALGSLDHPECQLAGTKVLTEKNGWVNIEDVKVGESILTLNEQGVIECHPILRKIESPYRGKMVHLKKEGAIDLHVTPNHKFPVFDAYWSFVGFKTANELSKKEGGVFIRTEICDNIFMIPTEEIEYIETEHDGMVYCLEVENHMFSTMDEGGNQLWSGNSSSLSGHDISHNILSLNWKGSTLIGEMELHLSPGYKLHGICSTSGDLVANMLLSNYLIGVSSRGVGTVNQSAGGLLVVDDDYDLVCWDVVIDPSTPGSYIKGAEEELRPFVENRTTAGASLNERLDKIDEILLL